MTAIGKELYENLMSVYVHRFMVDTDVVGCCWIELPKGKYRVRVEKGSGDTHSQSPGMVGPVTHGII